MLRSTVIINFIMFDVVAFQQCHLAGNVPGNLPACSTACRSGPLCLIVDDLVPIPILVHAWVQYVHALVYLLCHLIVFAYVLTPNPLAQFQSSTVVAYYHKLGLHAILAVHVSGRVRIW